MREFVAAVGGLVPAVDVEGPRVRFGLAWAAVTTVAVMAGAWPTALVFAGVALAAAGQTTQSWRLPRRPRFRTPMPPRGDSIVQKPEELASGRANRWRDFGRPPEVGAYHAGVTPTPGVAVFGAVGCALAGGIGPGAVLVVALGTVVAAVVVDRERARTTIAIALTIGLAAATPAIVRGQLGAVPALVLLFTVHAVDASAFVIGSGASNRWEGPVAGAAAAAAIGLAVAAAFVPPFRGVTPWVLAFTVATLAPVGGVAATALLGGRDETPVPALRRLDAWLVAGPVWAVVARLVLDLR
ncbi:MAG: hypothetical protein QOF60_162 [Actinomycetota bacterium]|jgi:hypothetical protein|nr:hypothetical protein [Actinomycetota bacterium]